MPLSCNGFSSPSILTGCGLPGRQGFILGAVTRRHRPWVISTVRESATLCTLPRFGIAYAGRFYGILATNNSSAGGLPWVRRITSLYPVQLHSGSVHRISGLALPRLLDLLAAAI